MRKLFYLLAILLVLGCKTEFPGVAPESPVLIDPANQTSCVIGEVVGEQATVLFEWRAAEEALFYVLEITNLSTNETTTISGIESTNFEILLDRGHYYQWNITAQNYIYQSRSIESYIFFLSNGAFSNTSPAPSVAINPPPGQTVSVELVTLALRWSSYDADLDDLTFNIIIDQSDTLDLNPVVIEGLETSEYTITLTPNTEYYWKVVAFDGQASTESQVFSFRTTPN
ncbi:MAG: fibronectin type III domain-containing protein [Flavobacteriaceae bacterium]|nr:fibronectin type III domain-containing protein [Flavobacteriaceae bacterium]